MTSQIIAVDEDHASVAGAIVYWRLSDETDGARLEAELEAVGLPSGEAPDLPSPQQALSRAAKAVARTAGASFVRKHRGFWYATEQLDEDGEPVFDAAWGVGLDAVCRLTYRGTASDEVRGMLREVYLRELNTLSRNDVSAWLLRTAEKCDAVSLRDTGGVYFVPRHALADFKTRAYALHAASSCRVHFVPAMHAETAVEAVLEALRGEVEAFVEVNNELLDKGEGGERMWNNRAAAAERLSEKVQRFEKLLGVQLDAVRGSLQEIHAGAVQAALAAMPDDEEG